MAPKSSDQHLQELFGANFNDIQAYCLRRLPAAEAADALSEVFLVAWRRIDEVPSDDASRLWLFTVARNVVRNMERSSRRRLRVIARMGGLAATHHADPESQVVAAEEHREMMAAFHGLSSSDQEILRLRLWEELSVTEAATVLGCGDKAASKRYQRALARLDRASGGSTSQRKVPTLHPEEVSSD